MKFQVPQFIEVEDKIFGPLTLKQFIYLCGGGGLSIILYLILPFFVSIFLILPVLAFSLAMAFYKVNNKPFIFLLESAIKYLVADHLYVWRKEDRPAPAAESAETALPADNANLLPRLGNSKLKEMSWALDTKGENIPVAGQKTTNVSPSPTGSSNSISSPKTAPGKA